MAILLPDTEPEFEDALPDPVTEPVDESVVTDPATEPAIEVTVLVEVAITVADVAIVMTDVAEVALVLMVATLDTCGVFWYIFSRFPPPQSSCTVISISLRKCHRRLSILPCYCPGKPYYNHLLLECCQLLEQILSE